MPGRARYNDRQYVARTKALKRWARANGVPCALCGKPFDWSIKDYRHPMSFTADHVHAMARGGALLGPLRPAHRRCNSARQAGDRDGVQVRVPVTKPVTSRVW